MKQIICMLLATISFGVLAAQNSEGWFTSNMAGKPIGYIKESIGKNEGKTSTATNMKLTFNRKDSKIEMFFDAETTEGSNGDFISARGNTRTTGQDISLKGLVQGDSLVIEMTTGGKTYTNKVAVKGKLTGPALARRRSITDLKMPGDSINYLMFSPELGIIVHVTRKLLAIDKPGPANSNRKVWRIQESFKENPSAREVWLDENYSTVKMVDPSPFGNIESIPASKEVALTAGENTIMPVESYENTIIRSNVRFTDPEKIEQIIFRVTLKNKNARFPDLTAANQKIIERGKDYAIVQCTRQPFPKNNSNKKLQNPEDYLSPNSLINSDDPDIIKITDEVTKGKKTDFEKAVALKNWVSANVKGDLGVALAPGSEVCKTRRGTCVAFSTFFSSLLRAAKIPTRYIAGYVYMRGIWGGHAWVEVFINGAWLPMDATINTNDIANTVRLSFGDGRSLKTGPSEISLAEGSILYGNADIKVLSFTINGKKVATQETVPYTNGAKEYTNPGKKFRIIKTKEFEFSNLDEVWPSRSFVTIKFKDSEVKLLDGYWMRGKSKEEAIKDETEAISKSTLAKKTTYNGSVIYSMKDESKAFFVISRGTELLIFYANGSNPVDKLKSILSNTRFENN